MANRIQLRRGGAQEWANANPILAQGELGIELDTGRIKIGDGVTSWNSLRYERPLESITSTANTLVQRDADGNFSAGNITANLIGSASTAQRLTTARQIQLSQDVVGSGVFDGSSNLNINALLQVVTTLPHYDGTTTSNGTYTKLTVDAKGRITNASNPTSYVDMGLTDVQPLDPDLTSLAALSALGMVSRTAAGTIQARTLLGTTGRIDIDNGNAVSGNPQIDLAVSVVTLESEYIATGTDDTALYNIPAIISVGGDDLPLNTNRTVNTVRYTLDRWGRFTSSETIPITTAIEGTKQPEYDAATSYSRYDIIHSGGNVYQALVSINSGLGAPSHTSGDAGGWRFLAAVGTPQKGLASFAQEDFDVDTNGHVTIAAAAIDNTQLQNNRLIFTDGNSTTDYELDNEHTTADAYTGFTTINTLRVNNTSGNSLLHVAHDQDLDVNTATATIFSDITLDKTSTSIQTINRQGSLTVLMDANTTSNRFLRFTANNAGAGEAKIEMTADNDISIQSTSNDVIIEDIHFNGSTIYGNTSAGTITIDPYPAGGNTAGTVSIMGDLTVMGTTTTVNSTVVTIDDPIITLAGDTAPTVNDSKDRGIEFRYYDTQARLGFFGWDNDMGKYHLLHAATNSSEVFSGTDSTLVAGSIELTDTTVSNTHTSGALIVAGGVGIGGAIFANSTLDIEGQVTIFDSLVIQAANEDFLILDGDAAAVFTVDTDTGNTVIEGTLDVQLETEITDNLIVTADNKEFIIRTAAAANRFTVDTDNGNTYIYGTLEVDNTSQFDANVTINADQTVNGNVNFVGANRELRIKDGSNITRFSVDYDNGNTNISGTLYAYNATTLNNTLTVNQHTELNSTLNVDGDATFQQDLIVNDVNSYFRVQDNNGTDKFNVWSNTGATFIQGSLTVNDNVNFNGSTFDVDNASTFRANIDYRNNNTYRYIDGAGNIEMTIDGATGNIHTDGTLDVDGGVTFNNTLDVDGATTLNSTLDVDGHTELNNTLNVDGNATFQNNVVINQNLTVNGTTTTVNSTVMTIDDPIITLGGDTAPSSNDGKDRGVEFRYYDGGAKFGFFGWDNNLGKYRMLESATNNAEVYTGTDATLRVGKLEVTGAGTSVDIDSNLNVDGTITVDGQLISNVATGTAPFTVASTTKVTNLNADLLDGMTTSASATGNTVVYRNAIGNFSANIITVNGGTGASAGIQGNALTADTLKTTRNIAIDGVVNGNVNFNGGSNVTITTTFDDADITALASQTTQTGYLVRTGNGTYDRRTFAVSGTGLTVTNGNGVSGNTTFTLNTNTASAANSVVLRDVNGNFAAGTITANLSGTATQVSNTLSVGTHLSFASGTSYNGANARQIVTDATSANVVGRLVARDSSGNFSAGTITANLTGDVTGNLAGNASTASTLQTARNIALSGDLTGSVSFNGGSNVTIASTLVNSGVTAGTYTKVTVDAKGRVTSATGASTADISENVNYQYFTAERAQDAVGNALVAGEGIDINYNDVNNQIEIDAEIATASNRGVASFNSNHLAVAGGEVKISQTFLENAFLQLQSMLSNLETTTTLIIRHTGLNTGLTVGDTFVGSVSGATGTITDVLNLAGGIKGIQVDSVTGFFVAGETLTFSTGGVANGETRVIDSTPFA